jgi:pilus assembly protein CpaE
VSVSLQALVALDDEIDRGLIDELVAGEAGVTVIDYLEVGGPTASSMGAGDVFIVACLDYTIDTRTYVEEAVRQHPSRPIVLLCPASSNGYLREAFDSGVDDIVTLPGSFAGELDPQLASQLVFALEKAVVRRRGGDDGERPVGNGRLITVLGAKGGSGKTLTAANLGVALAHDGYKVALVDLDLQFGDLALAMGLAPARTIYDLVSSGGSLDSEKLRDFLVEHPSGARALLAPLRPDHAAVVNPPFVREVLRLLHEMHEFVVVDTPPNFTPEVISAIDMSSDVVMVAMRDTLSLKNTKLGLETLERMDYDRRKITIVLNRANSKVGIAHQDVVSILGRDADIQVPSHRDITRSINEGKPIALERGSAAGRSFRQLAALYEGDKTGAAKAHARHRAPKTVRSVSQETEPAKPPADRRRRLLRRGR